MPTSYSDLLRLAKQANGENDTTWGTIFNANTLEMLEDAVSNVASVSVTGSGDYTLTTSNGSTDEARCAVLKFTGTPTANRNIIIPASAKWYIVHNAASAAYTMTIKIGVGTTVGFAQNERGIVYSDGTNVNLVIRVDSSGAVALANAVSANAIATASIQDLAVTTAKLADASVTTAKLVDASVTAAKVQDGVLTSAKSTSQAFIDYRLIPQSIKSADYTFALADAGGHILHPSSDTGARTFTIPANASVAFPIGSAITIINEDSAGIITLAITSDTLFFPSTAGTGSRSLAAGSVATILKITSTKWVVTGVNIT